MLFISNSDSIRVNICTIPTQRPTHVSSTPTDRVFATLRQRTEPFEFNDSVASVFDDMIERSVPGYRSIVMQTGMLAARFSVPGTVCYDLGSSLGAASLSMRHEIARHHQNDAAKISVIAIDNSEAMLSRMQERIDHDSNPVPLATELADISDYRFKKHSVAVLNFTLQFIPLEARPALIQSIADNMIEGGALILSEKIVFEDPQQQKLLTTMYENFKRANGYSELEISQKRDALENILIPETLSTHKDRLLNSGFKSVEVWFQCFSFASLVAIR